MARRSKKVRVTSLRRIGGSQLPILLTAVERCTMALSRLRPRAVARSARSDELRAARHLLRGGNLYEADPAVFGVHEASFGKRIFRFDLRPMFLNQVLDADA